MVTNVDALTYAGNLTNVEGLACENAGRYEFFQADIASAFHLDVVLRKHQYYAVVNFAAESNVSRSIDAPQHFIQTNILGTNILLDGARAHGVRRFIQISTAKVYGSANAPGERFSEDSLPAPTSPYAASKASADMLALTAWKTYGLEVVVLRPSNVYGSYQHPEKLLPQLVTRLLDRRPVELYGDGLNTREWVHVDDVSGAIMTALMEARPGSIYNISESQPISNLDLARQVASMVEAPSDLIHFGPDHPANDRRSAVDASAIRQDLRWVPIHPFEVGLQETVRWYTENRAWWVPVMNLPTRP